MMRVAVAGGVVVLSGATYYYPSVVGGLLSIGIGLVGGAYVWNPPLTGLSGAAVACSPTAQPANDAIVLPVPAASYYAEYHSHKRKHLESVHRGLTEAGHTAFVYLAGDSTLDNKHWLFSPWQGKEEQFLKAAVPAVNGYEAVLDPPLMVQDVSYWINRVAADRGVRTACIMSSIEESTLSDRDRGLLAQDEFIRDHISPEDTLIVSVGGNDIALRPDLRTVLHMGVLCKLTPEWLISAGLSPSMWYFQSMFKTRMEDFVERLVARTKPKKVIVCMLYYLDESPSGGWADPVLANLGYNDDPGKLQLVIRTAYERATSRVHIDGTEVVPLALFRVLDGKDPNDYKERVEPSSEGGRKMAEAFVEIIAQK